VRIKVRYPDFRTITRQARISVSTDSGSLIEALAVHLLRGRTDLDERGVRLIGVGVSGLASASARQLSLFDIAHAPKCDTGH
jgi:nucleotidyltransferase/DNA polymerase involved in DNA repair